ncbi:hydantoinase B/oxoprolinase family protein [Ferroplasma acidiphilum]|uniref:5-oxoprolinase n=1 Tax=Ferroplasma acidiphilum TaxID=74969 RepID=A0A1V0N1J7_9ARCH|nr:hydantoinase B/oxoprolinase family protein [Ferroplasma acidiphilum]ARD83964.1 hydantoinase_b/oxoprolinase [Ferroplasma acidiphilum]NOL60684.1 5-oxoprolinase [Ferroplasma acidiphilum]WMT52866.1 MAG: hydantoinase B/oxoprolinase family protein [Ferroplasma acidiphilum]
MTDWEIVGKATQFIAEEMGVALKRSAISPNIRERMDHSCAVLDSEGRIIAQAEHIPVHLGSFKIGSRNIINYMREKSITLKENEMLITNDPYISGTHLNDVTIIAPVYDNDKLFCYVINKAHNVDVGGPVFGSLNPEARNLYQEGLIIPPVVITPDIIRMILANFKDPETANGDLNAQISANRMGINRIKELMAKYGPDEIKSSWNSLIDHSRELSLMALKEWEAGEYKAIDYLEKGIEKINININLKISAGGVVADFEGTHGEIEYPLNAVEGVTFSAVAYAIRSAMQYSIPTNDGFYSVITIKAPERSLVNPERNYPVSGGNVETTQRIADVTLRALSEFLYYIPAASSGTMMNLMLGGKYGNKYWSYYETIGGGNGGRYDSNGESGIHSNMTNTLNTPVEIAEKEYPFFFTKNNLRKNSYGKGKYHGGEGIVRSFKVRSRTYISVIADRFIIPPWGLHGGFPGKTGKIYILSNGRKKSMPSKFSTVLEENDEVVIETPGGAAYGEKQ